jgi:hypothetical protein
LQKSGAAPVAPPQKPISDEVYRAHLEDFINRIMFRGDMDSLDDASRKQMEPAILALVKSQGLPSKSNEWENLALAALTSRTTRPGAAATTTKTGQAAQQQGQLTPQSVEAELATQGVKIPGTENAMRSALVGAGIEPRIKATTDPRADALLKRFGYDPR